MSEFTELVKSKGRAIKCEAAPGENGGHAGLILLVEEDKDRIILGRTDATFKTAKEAVAKMKETVDTIRNGKPEPEVEPEPVPRVESGFVIDPPLEPKKEPVAKKPPGKRKRKRKPRKRKGDDA